MVENRGGQPSNCKPAERSTKSMHFGNQKNLQENRAKTMSATFLNSGKKPGKYMIFFLQISGERIKVYKESLGVSYNHPRLSLLE
jgi:hypothetical protein